MKVIVDNKIPYIRSAIETIADEVVYAPGADFTPELVKDANALIIRTRTLCNEHLLHSSKVQFIATATIGFDHIDTAYLEKAGIAWTNCPGCNASSVGQYIHSCLILLKREKGLDLKSVTMGIVGVGHVGTEVRKAAESLGVHCLLNDPPRQTREGGDFVPIETIIAESDIITFHVPLTQSGPYRTYHLADESFFSQLHKCPIIINSSRGSVVDNHALLQALNNGQISDAIIDTWENEPNINLPLLNNVFIGTPHIAGYSADGKANATRMALEALCRHFEIQHQFNILPPPLPSDFIPSTDAEELFLQLYNPHTDSDALKAHPENFEYLRGNYPLRRETIS
jgi:erythronate-4-phosphate dehydrogenase